MTMTDITEKLELMKNWQPGIKSEPKVDPYAAIIDEMRANYPYGAEAVGMRSFMRMIVWIVLEMKRRGMI
jgi:hypothetical protein